MIPSVMTTRRAGRPIDLHMPRRLKSVAWASRTMAGNFLRKKQGRGEKAAETTQGAPPCQRARTVAVPLVARVFVSGNWNRNQAFFVRWSDGGTEHSRLTRARQVWQPAL